LVNLRFAISSYIGNEHVHPIIDHYDYSAAES
jgi:hypothetical protein